MDNFTKSVCIDTLERVKRHRLAGYPLGRGYTMSDLMHFRWVLRTNAMSYR